MSEETKQDSADPAGVEEAGFESTNNSREETEAIMQADSPDEIDKDLLEEIEAERKERLDPDNRPENAEVDNTQRTFIAEEARFEDHELSEEEKDDGIGQKEPDPEAQAGSTADGEEKGAADAKDADQEEAQQEAESDASTGPQPSGGEEPEAPTASEGQVHDEGSQEAGRHKA